MATVPPDDVRYLVFLDAQFPLGHIANYKDGLIARHIRTSVYVVAAIDAHVSHGTHNPPGDSLLWDLKTTDQDSDIGVASSGLPISGR